MYRLLPLFLALPFAFQCAPVLAQTYVKATGAAAWMQDIRADSDTVTFAKSYGFAVAIGHDFGPVALELEAVHARALVKDATALLETRPAVQGSITGLAVNGVWQPQTMMVADPYLFGGMGLGYVGFDPSGYDGFPSAVPGSAVNLGDVGLFWQVGAGLNMPLTDRLSAFIEARYVRVDLASPTGVHHMDAFSAWMTGGGLRYGF